MSHHISWNEVRKGTQICDKNGDTIGTVRNVQQGGTQQMGGTRQMGGGGTGGGTMGGGTMGGTQMNEGYVECECNLPGMTNKELFIPMNEFQDCTGNSCKLNLNKDEIERKGWNRRPTNM